jgi:uracil-DNA glycosylase
MNFADLVHQIRVDKNLMREVPGFDPENGHELGKYLFLLEAPGPKALQTGRISFDNPDPSAKNLREQLKEAGILRKDIALWNVVPWYLGNGTAISRANGEDIRAGVEYLRPLLSAMPNLCCIFLVGGAARRAHMLLSRITTARIVTCHHSSARVIIANSKAAKENIEVLSFVRSTT